MKAAAAERAGPGAHDHGERLGVERLGEEQVVDRDRRRGPRVELLLQAQALLEAELIVRPRDRDQRLRVELGEIWLANVDGVRYPLTVARWLIEWPGRDSSRGTKACT
jgi:hypothetical protein